MLQKLRVVAAYRFVYRWSVPESIELNVTANIDQSVNREVVIRWGALNVV